jgi:hypothetical protein
MKYKIFLAIAGVVLAHNFPVLVFADQTTTQKPTNSSEVKGEVGIYTGGRIVMTHKVGQGTETLVYSKYNAAGRVVEQQTMTTDTATGAYTLEELKHNAQNGTLDKTTKLGMTDPEQCIAKH